MALPEFYTTGVLHGLQFFRIALLVRPELKFHELLAVCEDVVREQRLPNDIRSMEDYFESLMALIRDRNP